MYTALLCTMAASMAAGAAVTQPRIDYFCGHGPENFATNFKGVDSAGNAVTFTDCSYDGVYGVKCTGESPTFSGGALPISVTDYVPKTCDITVTPAGASQSISCSGNGEPKPDEPVSIYGVQGADGKTSSWKCSSS